MSPSGLRFEVWSHIQEGENNRSSGNSGSPVEVQRKINGQITDKGSGV